MLNQILQILLLCFTAIILTTGIAFSSPLSSGIPIAENTSSHETAKTQPAQSVQPNGSSQRETASPTPTELNGDRNPQPKDIQSTQADPSVPYDPYDYDAIREMDRRIYGEVKGTDQE